MSEIKFTRENIFVIGSKIINSCITKEQLENATRAVDLIRNISSDESLINELIQTVEKRSIQIENDFSNSINDINVIYEKVENNEKS